MRRRSRGNGAVGEALTGLYSTLESGTRLRESLALAYWPEVVGEANAAASEPDSVRDGVLFVNTRSSVWSHELSFFKHEIIAKLNSRLGRPVIRDVIFRAQGVRKISPVQAPDHPTEDDLKLVVLTASDQAALNQDLDSLVTIRDEALRESVRSRIVRDRRLRRWRLDHGWKTCGGCQAVHNTEERLCPICRLCR